MDQINDCILKKTGGPTLNQGLMSYYLAHGGMSKTLNEAEREFLLAQGVTPSSVNDMWREYLTNEGYTGALADQLKQFWCANDPTTGVPKVIGSVIPDSQRDGILVRWDRPMAETCPVKDQINVVINGAAAVHPTAIQFHPHDKKQMGIIMATPFTATDVVTWAYDDSGPCDLAQVAAPHTEADNQTYGVTNLIKNVRLVVDGSDAILDGTDVIIDI